MMLGTPHRASQPRILSTGANYSTDRAKVVYAGSVGVAPHPEPEMGYGQAPGGTAPYGSHTKRKKNTGPQMKPWPATSRKQATLRPDLHTNAAYP